MAENQTSAPPPPPPPPPPAPKVNVAKQAAKEIESIKTGFDPLRPVRYTYNFVSGTFGDMFDGMAKWGARGLKWGALAGVVAGIALGPAGILATGVLGSMLVGAATIGAPLMLAGILGGGTYGALTGGMRAVNRQRRGELYAEDLVERENTRKVAPPNRTDYREAARARKERSDRFTVQALERQAEIAKDDKTYWQDQVSNGRHQSRGIWG